jgi:hypothetical protein
VATRSHAHTRPLDADALATTLGGLLDQEQPPDHTVIGIEPCEGGLQFHLAPVPYDERLAAAGLFCMEAPPSWCAVATTGSGRARHPEQGHVVGTARSLVVVDRAGGVASRIHFDPLPDSTECEPLPPIRHSDDPGPVAGLAVDALHRMLGLASPGQPPAASHLALAIWSQELIVQAVEGLPLDWSHAVALHPAEPADGAVDASVETVVEATLRTEGTVSWRRLHRRAADSPPHVDLSPEEIAWMDPVLFARWVVSSLPDPHLAAEVLRHHDAHRTADLVESVARQVLEKVGPMTHG